MHVVDKFWDPDPLVALAIPVGLALLGTLRRFSCPACLMFLPAQDRLFQASRSPLGVGRGEARPRKRYPSRFERLKS